MERRLPRRFARIAGTVVAMSLVIVPAAVADDGWAALQKGGHVALIRHGNAPPGYGGDPPGFKIDDCKTQRNLDEQGRARPGRSARRFAARVSAWTASCPRRGAGAWRRRA